MGWGGVNGGVGGIDVIPAPLIEPQHERPLSPSFDGLSTSGPAARRILLGGQGDGVKGG